MFTGCSGQGHMSNPYSKRKRYALDVEAWVQFKLLRMAAFHPGTKKADIAVLAEIIQRYWGKYGNGYVSDKEICDLTGLCDRTIGRSRQRLTSLGFVQVVRGGGRGHATVYNPNFGLVPKGDTAVTDIKGDIQVHETDPSVTLNGGETDPSVTPSYLQTGLQTGHLIDRLDSAPASPPAGAGLKAAPPEAPEDGIGVKALIAAYAPADMCRPARAAYKRAWEAIPAGTDLARVIDRAADWHQSWAQQNDPHAPRTGLVRWLEDEMWLKPVPGGYQPKDRPARVNATSNESPTRKPRKTKPVPSAKVDESHLGNRAPRRRDPTVQITAADVVVSGYTSVLSFTAVDEDGKTYERSIIIQHDDEKKQEAGQRQLSQLVDAAGLAQVADCSEFIGRSIVLAGKSGVPFLAPPSRPDDEPPPPPAPERVVVPKPPIQWPAWMDEEIERDD